MPPARRPPLRVGCVEKPPVGIVANAWATRLVGRHEIVDADHPEGREHQRSGSPSARRRGTRACAQSSGSARREPRSPGPGSSDSMSCRPPTRSRGSTAIARTMIPMPPSHCVNWRQIAERAVDLVEVGDDARPGRREPGHALEVGVERVRELVAALEEVRDRRERGCHEPGQRDDEEALAHADRAGSIRRQPLEHDAESARDHPG